MKFSGKMSLMVILKVTKKPGLHPFSEKRIFWKNHRGSQIDPTLPAPSHFGVSLKKSISSFTIILFLF